MSQGGHDGHPDHDLLADLAADVLPAETARVVESHVFGCAWCADLLADAEWVRGLLIADDLGPMPPDVLTRIESALTLEQPDAPTAAWRRFVDEEPPAQPVINIVPSSAAVHDSPFLDADTTSSFMDADTSSTMVIASGRRDVRRVGSRRDARQGGRSGRRYGISMIAVAAGLLAVFGGVKLFQSTVGQTSSATSSAAAPATDQPAAGSAATRQSTTRYTAKDLIAQAQALIAATERAPADTVTAPKTFSAPAADQPLTQPGALQACLAALKEDGPATAVDLATFNGREAAIIIVPGQAGGYDVWVVARNCKPGAEGTLAFKTLPP